MNISIMPVVTGAILVAAMYPIYSAVTAPLLEPQKELAAIDGSQAKMVLTGDKEGEISFPTGRKVSFTLLENDFTQMDIQVKEGPKLMFSRSMGGIICPDCLRANLSPAWAKLD